MLYKISYLFILFFLYSVIGYICEVLFVTLCQKKLTLSRGFLIGPYIPIYGVSIICMVKLLSKYQDDLLVLFIMSTLICTILEYITSYLMEKIFKLRWWDYSHENFNVNGRVCLTNSIMFGIGGVAITKFINPLVESLLNKVPNCLIITISIIFAIIIIIDLVISYIAMFNIEIEAKKYTRKDATDAIKQEVSEFLRKHNFIREQIERLFRAFPNVKSLKNINFPDYKELIKKIKEEVQGAKEEYKKKKKVLKEKYLKNK